MKNDNYHNRNPTVNILGPKAEHGRASYNPLSGFENDKSHSPVKPRKRVTVMGVSCRGMSNPFLRHQQEIGEEGKQKILSKLLVRPEPILRKATMADSYSRPAISNRATPLFPSDKNPHLSQKSKMAETSPWATFKKEVNKTNPSPSEGGPTPPPDGRFIMNSYVRPRSKIALAEPKYIGTDLYAALAKSQQKLSLRNYDKANLTNTISHKLSQNFDDISPRKARLPQLYS